MLISDLYAKIKCNQTLLNQIDLELSLRLDGVKWEGCAGAISAQRNTAPAVRDRRCGEEVGGGVVALSLFL